MKSQFYKPIKRWYWDIDREEWKWGKFIARGIMANGQLAYTMIDEEGNDIEGEETSWLQCRQYGKLVMFHI